MVTFDNMRNRPIKGSAEWTSHDVVLDVPVGAASMSFDILLTGTGEGWMSDLSSEAVGKTVPATSPVSAPLSWLHTRRISASRSSRNIGGQWFPLYNPNMSGGVLFASDASLARPIQMLSAKVCP